MKKVDIAREGTGVPILEIVLLGNTYRVPVTGRRMLMIGKAYRQALGIGNTPASRINLTEEQVAARFEDPDNLEKLFDLVDRFLGFNEKTADLVDQLSIESYFEISNALVQMFTESIGNLSKEDGLEKKDGSGCVQS